MTIKIKSIEYDIPNNETIEAMKESERLINDKNAQKFDSVDSLFEELES